MKRLVYALTEPSQRNWTKWFQPSNPIKPFYTDGAKTKASFHHHLTGSN